MDTTDAQASLGSDGIIESHPSSALMIESTSVIETTTTTVQSPTQQKVIVSILFSLYKDLQTSILGLSEFQGLICIKSTRNE